MMSKEQNQVKTIIKTGEEIQKQRLNGTQRVRESFFILLTLFAILLAVALVTFHPADPSWSQTAWESSEIHNAGGNLGAWAADTLFFTFGLLAYLMPILLVAGAWMVFFQREADNSIDFMLWGTRLLGTVLLLLSSCGLADVNFDDIWYFSSGGVIGDVLTSLSISWLNLLGTMLALFFFWCAGFTLLTGVSWLVIVERLGEISLNMLQWGMNRLRGDRAYQLEAEPFQSKVLESTTQTSLDETFSQQEEMQVVEIANNELKEPLEPDSSVPSSRRFTIHMPVQPTTIEPEEIQQNLSEQESDYRHSLLQTIEQLDALANIDSLSTDIEEVPSITSVDLLTEPEIIQSVKVQVESETTEVSQQVIEPTISDEPSMTEETQNDENEQDTDVLAFQQIVASAQANAMSQQNPFLVQAAEHLPKPTEPMPTLQLLYHPEQREDFIDQAALEDIARLVESKLADYKIQAHVVDIFPGPVITRFELDLAPGVKVSRISNLSMDLARSLSAAAVRVVEVIPGKPYVGLELPNLSRQTVYLSDVISSPQFTQSKSPTTIVLGQDIAGEAVVADLAKMPHVLVAGTTGSGKSVGVNVMILSILYKATPEEVRFIMIDPKMLELSVYEGIPHLLSEVVTDMKDASNALRWCVAEMERRYKLMSALGVRNIKGFNEKLVMAANAGHPIHDPLWQESDSMDETAPLLEKLPYIVVVVDEFADLIMVVGKKVEELIARLAQKARAAGIHLILATQRPSVDVITGLIKANIPTRIAFTVSTKVDSRTILDQSGAESLLGMGDMLYLPPGSSHTIRVHGAFASDDDVHAVVNNWKARGTPNYISEIISGDQGADGLLPGERSEEEEELDPLFDQVVEYVVESRRGSVSGVQRRFKIGYNRAARIVEQLEAQGIVSAPGSNGNREVLAPASGRHQN